MWLSSKRNCRTGARNSIRAGDEVKIDTGDNEVGPAVTISRIEYLPKNVVRIVTTKGETIECLLKEIL